VDTRTFKPALPTATGSIVRLAYAKARAAGLNLDLLLRDTRLSISQIEDPEVRIKAPDQIQFLNLVARALPDEFLGFHLAQAPDPREFGLLYHLLASAPTIGAGLDRVARYSSILDNGIRLHYAGTGQTALSLHHFGVNRLSDQHQIEFFLTAIVRICRVLSGLQLTPICVRLIHFRKTRAPDFAEFFGDDVEFGSATDAMAFAPETAGLPVVTADPYLNDLLTAYCEAAIAQQPDSGTSFRSKVEAAVIPLLPHRKAKASEIARQLAVGQRTLARRLSSEGFTFSDLLDELRFRLANRYLSDRNLSISQIAWLLGYKEVSGFSHAFKRWSGRPPRKARA